MTKPPETASLTVRGATAEDAKALAPRLRAGDLRELAAATPAGTDPAAALLSALTLSEFADVVLAGETPVALYGVVPLAFEGGTHGFPWLVGTDDIGIGSQAFMDASRDIVRKFEASSHPLLGFVHAGNIPHIRWLVRCGFTLASDPEVFGENQTPFVRFWRRT